METDAKKFSKKKLIIVVVVIVTAIVALCLVFVLRGKNSSRQLSKQLDLGQRYLTEMDYEAAIVAFQAAIQIDPKNVEAYLGIVEAYEQQGQYHMALKYAKQGYEGTGDEALGTKIEELNALIAAQRDANAAATETSTEEEVQKSRIMTGLFLDRLSLGKEEVLSVSILDSTSDAPSDAVDASFELDGSVLEWKVADGDLYDVYIAADGSVIAHESSTCLFEGFLNATSMDLHGLDTSNTTNMAGMFVECTSLTYLDLSNFDTGNVTSMQSMFASCTSLTGVNVSSFDTSNVTDMMGMFVWCAALETVDVSGFDTSQVTSMDGMFQGCNSLASIDVSGFDTGNVTDMMGMFDACYVLESVDVSGFDTGKVTDMHYMFLNCKSLTSLDVSNFDTSNVTDMNYMFAGCESLRSLDVSGFDMSNVTDTTNMFYGTIWE